MKSRANPKERTIKIGGAALVLVLVMATTSVAELETYQWTVELENVDGFRHLAEGRIDAPQFDPEDGARELRNVRFRLEFGYEICFRIENTSEKPGIALVWGTTAIDLAAAGVEIWGPPYGRAGGGPYLEAGESFDWCFRTTQLRTGWVPSGGREQFVGEGTVGLDHLFGIEFVLDDPEPFDIEFLECTCPIPFTLTLEYCFAGPCSADLTGDKQVGFDDVIALLAAWGDECLSCPEDLTCDSEVGLDDLLELLAAWGPCDP